MDTIESIDFEALAATIHHQLYHDYPAMSSAYYGMELLLEAMGFDEDQRRALLNRVYDAVGVIEAQVA